MDQSITIDLTASIVESTKSSIVFSEKVSGTIEANNNLLIPVVTATTDKEVDLSTLLGSNADFLIISSPQIISVKLNANTNFANTGKLLVLTNTSVSKVFISNASGVDVDVKIIAGG